MNDKQLNGGIVQAAVYKVGLEAGVQVITPDGKSEFYLAKDDPIYKAYQRHIDFGIVAPFVAYNGSRVLVRQKDTLVTVAGVLLAIMDEKTAAQCLSAVPDKKENDEPLKEIPVNASE